MTTFVLLHGAWHDPTCWEPLAAELRAGGHEALAPELPLHDPRAVWMERIDAAVAAVPPHAPGPVVVVGHSMGAGYAPYVAAALGGRRSRSLPLEGSDLDVPSRAGSDGAASPAGAAGSGGAAGPTGAAGAPAVVLLCPGLGPLREGFPWPATRADGASAWEPAAAIAALYPRLAPATAQRLAARLRPMAPPPDRPPSRPDPPAPTAIVLATDDELFDPASEREKAVRRPGADVREIAGGHLPMLEDPAALAALLTRLALSTAPPSAPRP